MKKKNCKKINRERKLCQYIVYIVEWYTGMNLK